MSCRYGDDTCCCVPNCEDVIDMMGGGICDCGVVIENPYESDQCSVCAAAPHHRECSCDECVAYWHRISESAATPKDTMGRGNE